MSRAADHELPMIPWRDERLSDWANRAVPLRCGSCPMDPARTVHRPLRRRRHQQNRPPDTAVAGQVAGAALPGLHAQAGPVYGLFCEDTARRSSAAPPHRQNAWGYDSLAGSPISISPPWSASTNRSSWPSKDQDADRPGTDASTRRSWRSAPISLHSTRCRTSSAAKRSSAARCPASSASSTPSASPALRHPVHRPSIRPRPAAAHESAAPAGRAASRQADAARSRPGRRRGRDGAEDRQRPSHPEPDKSNYAKQGETIELVIRDGTFFVTTVGPEAANKPPKSGPGRNDACDAKFLELLAAVTAQGSYVNESVHRPLCPERVRTATRPWGLQRVGAHPRHAPAVRG